MNLYKVQGSAFTSWSHSEVEFILAITESRAIIKFIELHNNDCKNLRSEIICDEQIIIKT